MAKKKVYTIDEALSEFFAQLKPSTCKDLKEYNNLRQYRRRFEKGELKEIAKKKIATQYAGFVEKCMYTKKK